MLSESDFYCDSKPIQIGSNDRRVHQRIENQLKLRQKCVEHKLINPYESFTVRCESLFSFNLVGMKLQGVRFNANVLRDAAFDNCVGSHLSFLQCSMNHAKFTNCQVTYGNFVDCSFVRASFSGIFKHIHFIRCYMNHADLTGAKFINCRFANTELTGAKLSLDPADWEGSTLPSGVKVS